MSQSGGLGIAIIEAGRLGSGLSSFVSVGNKSDLSGNDLLRYWEEDPGTEVALLYLESFGNPRKFARIAPRFARRKPLLAVKSGRPAAGARATSSHTGALLSASDVTVDALFEQAGVIRTDTLHELFAVASLLTSQPVPRGDRVAIVTNAGGPGIMCADACQADGVDVLELPAAVQAQLADFLPPAASLRNPIDMIATASAGDYRRTLETLIDAEACDAILAIFVPPLVTEARDVAAAIRGLAETKPPVAIAAVFMTSEGTPAELGSERARVPGYEFPEDAARAVALAAKHGRWRARPEQQPATAPDTRPEQAAAIISEQLAEGAAWLAPARVAELFHCYGLPLITTRVVSNTDQAVAAAAELGPPVALKASAQGLLHKTDAGGVKLGLEGDEEVRAAAADQGRRGANHAGERSGRSRDDPLAADLPPARWLSRRGALRPHRDRGRAGARERTGRGPPGDRRARLQPADRRAERGGDRRRAGPRGDRARTGTGAVAAGVVRSALGKVLAPISPAPRLRTPFGRVASQS
jgi:acyl-CoA synthetase (NDP forming)